MSKQKATTIPIFFTFDKYYVLGACVAFHTLLQTANPHYHYVLFVVHTGLKEKHQRRLQNVVKAFPNAELHFRQASYNINWEMLKNKSYFSKEIFFKLTAQEMFPEFDRILFSDVDVIFKRDLSEAYFLFPEDSFYFAGPPSLFVSKILTRYTTDFTPQEIELIKKYEVSAGFMLMNLKQMREDKIQSRLTEFFNTNHHRLILPEQDCIALCFPYQTKFLPNEYCVSNNLPSPAQLTDYTFNIQPEFMPTKEDGLNIYHSIRINPIVIHYVGHNKPWNSPFVPLYSQWLLACKDAKQLMYYLCMQPQFLVQRLRRYSLRRFLGKVRKRLRA